MKSPFPRADDGLGHAWGGRGTRPQEVWERFSEPYEAQAQALWACLETLGLEAALDWAGSQDGEAIIGRDSDGEIVVLYHLEDPDEAIALQGAASKGELRAFVETTIADMSKDAGSEAPPRDR